MVFASMRAVCVFLRARAVVKYFLRAASTLENTDGEQRALRVLRKFSASWNLSFINRILCFAPEQKVQTKGGSTSPSILQPIVPCSVMPNYVT